MALAGNCVVLLWTGIRDDMREDFMEWHAREHMAERLGINGFLRGRRCISLDGAPEFLIVFELRDAAVLLSEEYRTRLTHPTPWSASILPALTDNTRGACRIEHTEGHAMGGFVLTLRLAAQDGREAALIAAVRQDVMPLLCTLPRITGAHFVRNDVPLTEGNTGYQRGRAIHLPDLIVMLEGSDAQAVNAVGERLLGNERLEFLGAKAGTMRGLYQLEYSIQNLAP